MNTLHNVQDLKTANYFPPPAKKKSTGPVDSKGKRSVKKPWTGHKGFQQSSFIKSQLTLNLFVIEKPEASK